MRFNPRAAVCVLGLALAMGLPGVAGAGGFTLGFSDDEYFQQGPLARNALWIDRASRVGAKILRLNLIWPAVAPHRPPGSAQARDPSWSGYQWTAIDDAVREAHARDMRVLLTVLYTPVWAQNPGAPQDAPWGSPMPDLAALRDFTTAAARRYDGSYPDPQSRRSTLPRVNLWQAWNEPNLATYLSPQAVYQNGRLVDVGASAYRQMANVVYAAVKHVQPGATVVSAGMSPYGDYPPDAVRTPPARFWRDLLCLTGALTPLPCPDPAHFDAVDHHPYDIKGPHHAAVQPDDLTLPDITKLRRIVTAAQRYGTVLPTTAKRYWVTEFTWETRPPDPGGVPIQRQARWLEDAFYVLWEQGVDTITWYKIGDSAPIPSYRATYQSGVFFVNGAPKPAATAFRFPFVVECPTLMVQPLGGVCLAWGKAPARRSRSIAGWAGDGGGYWCCAPGPMACSRLESGSGRAACCGRAPRGIRASIGASGRPGTEPSVPHR